MKDNAIKIWNGIKGALVPVFEALHAALDPVERALGQILAFMEAIRDKAGDVVDAVEKIAGAAGKIGGLVGKIPGLATGGPVSAGQAYVVGERGPELFVPSTKGSIIPNHALSAPASFSGGGGTGGNTHVYITVEGSVISEADLTATIRNELVKLQNRNVSTGIR